MAETLQPKRSVVGTGEMADAVRGFPWHTTALGPIATWPETLLATVNMLLCSRHPILLMWGAEMVLLYNDAFRPVITNRHPQALGQPGREFWVDVWPVVGKQLEGVLNEGKSVYFEAALVPILRNGQLQDAYFDYSYSPVHYSTGEIGGIIVICQDVTNAVVANRERSTAQETLRLRQEELDDSILALHTERRRLLSMVQQAPAFFALLEGTEHVIAMVNPLYTKLVGNRDVVGKRVADALPEATEQGYVKILDKVLSTGEPFVGTSARFDIVWTEGRPPEERYLNFVYQPMREADNSISGIIVLGVDVTENKRAEKALIQNEKLAAVGRMAASIAHEINNPLESVTNLLYIAQHTTDIPEINRLLNTADQEMRRVANIVNQTLRFHKQASRPQLVSCLELFSTVLQMYASRLANSSVLVEKRKRATRPANIYEGDIRQVLNNLVGNALDAMPKGGRLLIRSHDSTDWRTGRKGLLLTIADTGIGMDAATRARIFEAFYTTKGINGTGLGLWISEEIMARHGGRILIRSSQCPDKSGTVATLFLPFDGPPALTEPLSGQAVLA